MADMAVGDRTQFFGPRVIRTASRCWSQLWLRPKFDASFLGGGPPPMSTSKDAASFVLRQGSQKRQDALAERRGQIQHHCRSRALKVAPRPATRLTIRIPSSM